MNIKDEIKMREKNGKKNCVCLTERHQHKNYHLTAI